MSRLRQTIGDIFRWPLLLGALTAIGLASALFGDGGWDALSWTVMAVPLAVLAWKASSTAIFKIVGRQRRVAPCPPCFDDRDPKWWARFGLRSLSYGGQVALPTLRFRHLSSHTSSNRRLLYWLLSCGRKFFT
jgi:hypothetical protein